MVSETLVEFENHQIVSIGLNSGILDSRGIVEYDLTQVNRDKPVQSAASENEG